MLVIRGNRVVASAIDSRERVNFQVLPDYRQTENLRKFSIHSLAAQNSLLVQAFPIVPPIG
jgi:hypothetical protein